MWNLLKNAWKVVEVRKKLIYTFMILLVIRFGSVLPIPGVNTTYFASLFGGLSGTDAFGWFNAMTGGSFQDLSIFALSITPYITSSIIMQLLTIAIPKLEELQKDGEEGRKKIAEYTRYVTIGLALIESTAMAVGFGGRGLLYNYNILNIIVCVVTMTAGSAILMWFGERINENGIGNGISIILLFNILSSLPDDIKALFNTFVRNDNIAVGVVMAAIVLACIAALFVFTIILNDAKRVIPVQYSRKMQGRRQVGSKGSNIPLKVNTAGVMPVIFASSLMSIPSIIGQFFTIDYSSIGGRILMVLTSSYWCNPAYPWASIGFVIYIVLVYAFAYFYTSISFNPLEVANNIKKAGGFIPGMRPGRQTSDYLSGILKYIIFIGATGLAIVAAVPIIASGLFGIMRLSFTGTSLIIITSVIIETLNALEAQLLVRNYKGFLND